MMEKKKPARIPVALRVIQTLFTILGPIFPKTMAKLADYFWTKTHRYPVSQYEKKILNEGKKFTLKTQEGELPIWSWGQGPIILFLHGWHGRASQVAKYVHPLVAGGYQVVAYDSPAHGQAKGSSSNVLKQNAALKDVINKIGPIHGVLTHSFGAVVFLMDIPNEFDYKRCVFICPPYEVQDAILDFSKITSLPDNVVEQLYLKFKKDFGEDILDKVSPKNNVANVTAPCLIIHDQDDTKLPCDKAEKLSKLLKNSIFVRTKNLGHFRILSNERVVQMVTRFFVEHQTIKTDDTVEDNRNSSLNK